MHLRPESQPSMKLLAMDAVSYTTCSPIRLSWLKSAIKPLMMFFFASGSGPRSSAKPTGSTKLVMTRMSSTPTKILCR